MAEERLGTRNTLNEELAVRILGYHWVVWANRDRFPLPHEEEGRFLAPPEGPLAHEQVPAGPEVPLAKEPDRYVPMFCEDPEAAFDLARKVGLFVSSNGFLAMTPTGGWEVQDEKGQVLGVGASIPEAVCRAVLRWDENHGSPERGHDPG